MLLLLAVVAAALLVAHSSFPTLEGRRGFCLFDDAMISLRYGANLAHGHGLVWNPGQRVEGFTNPLMVFLMAGVVLLAGTWYAPLVIQILGVAVVVAGLVMAARLARRASDGRDGPVLTAVVCVMAFYPFAYWSLMGMETGLLTVLLLVAVSADARDPLAQDPRARAQLVVASALALLTRPDAGIMVAAVFLLRLLRSPSSSWRRVVLDAAVTLLPLLGYLVFRRAYYGQWLANVYYLKLSGLPLGRRVANGLAFCRDLVPATALAGLLAAALVVLARRRRTTQGSLLARRALLLFLLGMLYQVLVGGDAWPPYWRFTVPAQVLLLAAAPGVVEDLRAAGLLGARGRAGALLALVVCVATDSIRLYPDLRTLIPWTSDFNHRNANIGLALRRLTTDRATVAAYWAGAIPYYAEREAIDLLGKMDPNVVRQGARAAVSWGGMDEVPGHNKIDLAHSLVMRRPTFIQYSNIACSVGGVDLRSWCRENYALVDVAGMKLLLAKGAPEVRWEYLRP